MESQSQAKSEGSGDAQQRILGYLNFSSGASDPQFLSALNELFREHTNRRSKQPTWSRVCKQLQSELKQLQGSTPAFADTRQASLMLDLLLHFCPSYRQYHEDALAHQSDQQLFNGFLFGRAAEVLLSLGPQADVDADAMIQKAIRRLSDFIGYRPVATLETQKIEPYAHEWIRPVPLYIAEVGSAAGPYEELIRQTVLLLQQADPQLLREAYFDPSRLDELAFDPRAYDFDHPANKRPNYHFGQWDPNLIDGDGFYRRFVIQQVTMDCLLERIEQTKGVAKDELLYEAAAVLAGTVLMASGISGYGPETHHSTVTLSSLLVKIAGYRDGFYQVLLQNLDNTHGARLREEAARLQQPFAGARQALNRHLAHCRAVQMQRVHLARNFALMGYGEAAANEADLISVPSARLMTQIDNRLHEARASLKAVELPRCLAAMKSARETLARAIDCGAVVDPWNILGFDGNFSLFGSIENSLRDYRIDDLVVLIEELLELFSRLWSKAAATEQHEVAEETARSFEEFANWWHQFAAHELDSADAENPLTVYEAAKNVSSALRAWHAQGEATGDIGFWAPHVQKFDSCRAYWLVINTLLSREDKVATLGLLMHWLSQAERIPLEQGETSFFQLCLRLLSAALDETGKVGTDGDGTGWKRVRRFFDYFEANAGDYGLVPEFTPDPVGTNDKTLANDVDEGEEEPEQDELFSAAYENVVYRDSTDDGMEGSIFDFDSHDEDYLQQMSRPIVDRLLFIEQMATAWKLTSVSWTTSEAMQQPDVVAAQKLIPDLLRNASIYLGKTSRDLRVLANSVQKYRLAHPSGDPDSMVHFDRLRLLRDSLIDQIIHTHVLVIEAQQFLLATYGSDETKAEDVDLNQDELNVVQVLRAAVRGDEGATSELWHGVSESLEDLPILYVPLARGGPAQKIIEVKARQQLIQNLLFWFPRIGLLHETYELIELVRDMERHNVVGAGAITEFDNLFEMGCAGVVTALIDSAEAANAKNIDDWLVASLEEAMEPLLHMWLTHSRTLRLSVLEQVMDEAEWQELVTFITKFGRDLFTQRFLNLGNVRGILYQGVDTWLETMHEYGGDDQYAPLLDALEHDLNKQDAIDNLTLVLEAIVENYAEYRDYNSITTQSDHGELLFSLLDFLRLRISYDRVVWNLRPMVLAHQVLAARGRDEAAEKWRRNLQAKIGGEADRHIKKLRDLEKKYAMQLPSISKRIAERFMRPLMIDYLCALIEPAMHSDDPQVRETAFDGIQAQTSIFMDEPSGAGLDVPAWLMAMEDTIRSQRNEQEALLHKSLDTRIMPSVKLSLEDVGSELAAWNSTDDEDEDDDSGES